MRGPVENIPALLQPVAHALLQALDEVMEIVQDFPEALLWHKPLVWPRRLFICSM